MTLPFIHPVVFTAYLLVLLGVGIAGVASAKTRWTRERQRVRKLLLNCLQLRPEDFAAGALHRQVLALVPAVIAKPLGLLAQFPPRQPVWLCFLANYILVLPSDTGDPIVVAREAIQSLQVGSCMEVAYVVGLEMAGGVATFEVGSLADVVRTANILLRQRIHLRHLKQVG